MINQKLIDSGLFAARMVDVTGPMVDLYNRCLLELGFTPTNLKSFRIDGYGWSPEIAQEQGNNAYLSHGDANPFAIILSPDQANLPVFYPYHNFDRKMMSFVYEDFKTQIEEITKTTAIMVDIDRYVQFLERPENLLQYNKITVKCKILGNLQEGKIEQDELINNFKDGDNYLNSRSQQKLLANIRQYGDLRNKMILMKPESYPVSSFYTRMFGGVFVLRSESHINPFLICVDKKWVKKTENSYHIMDKNLIDVLYDNGYTAYLEHEQLLERMKTWAFVSAIADKPRAHAMKDIMKNTALFTKYLQQYKDDLTLYRSFDARKVENDPIAKFTPNPSLPTTQFRLVWKLLTTMKYYDIFLLYKWNKEKFYREFNTFKEDVQDWIVDYVVMWNKKYYEDHPEEA
jgi:hypothetical protein